MGVIEDVRKVIQDLVTPDLKALAARQDSSEENTTLRFAALSEKMDSRFSTLSEKTDAKFAALIEKMDSRFNALSAKIDANHVTVIHSLNIDKRLEALERDRQPATA